MQNDRCLDARTGRPSRVPGKVLASVLVAFVAWSTWGGRLLAEGTEMLGPPAFGPVTGTRLMGDGAGLLAGPGELAIAVPAGAVVERVLLYWNGFHAAPGSTTGGTALLNGTLLVTGTPIGGSTFFFPGAHSTAYRADITALGLLVPGTVSIVTVAPMAFDVAANGVSIVAVIDAGERDSLLEVRDGQDLAFVNFAPPLDTTVPQAFSFPALPAARDAELTIIAGSVEGPGSGTGVARPSIVRVTLGSVTTDYPDLLSSTSGLEWDHIVLALTIPPGVSDLQVQLLSEDCCASGNLPASMAWVATGLSVFPAPGSVAGLVYCDDDDDGVPDPGEPGLAGRTIELRTAGLDAQLDTADDGLVITLTAADGTYLFTDVASGLCRLTLDTSVLPLGKEIGLCPTVVTVDLAQAETLVGADFCLRPDAAPDTIADKLWLPLPTQDAVVVLNPAGEILGTLDSAGQEEPVAVAVASTGVIWVVFRASGSVVRYSPLGELLDVIPAGADPQAIAIDAQGAAWIANVQPRTLTKIRADGVVVFGVGGVSGAALALAGEPRGLAVDLLDNLYLATASPAVLDKRNASGQSLATLPLGTSADPVDLVLDRGGHVWLVLRAQEAVQRRASDLSIIETYELPGADPTRVVVRGAAEAWVLARGDATVRRLQAGGVAQSFVVGGLLAGLAVDGRGQVWVADEAGGAVRRLSPNGTIEETIALPGVPRFRGDASGVTQANVLLPGADFDTDGFDNALEIDSLSNPFDPLDLPSAQPTFVAPVDALTCQVQLTQVSLAWTLPLAVSLSAIEVRRDGVLVATVPGNATAFAEPAALPVGAYNYAVRGVQGALVSQAAVCAAVVGSGQVLGAVGVQVANLDVNIFDITVNPGAEPGEPFYYLTDPANGKIYGTDANFLVLVVIDSPLHGFAPTTGIAFNPDGNGGLGSLMVAAGPNGDPLQVATVQELSLTGVPLGTPIQLHEALGASSSTPWAAPFGGSNVPILGGLSSMSYKKESEVYKAVSPQNCELFSFKTNPLGVQAAAARGASPQGAGPQPTIVPILPAASAYLPLPGYGMNGVFVPERIDFDENGGRVWVTGATPEGTFELVPLRIQNGVATIEGTPVPLAGVLVENAFGGFTLRADQLAVVGVTTSTVYSLASSFFRRGDTDSSNVYDVGDAIRILTSLFEGQPFRNCVDAYDVNDSGVIGIDDAVHLLGFLFAGGPQPALPFAEAGPDPSPDGLPCL